MYIMLRQFDITLNQSYNPYFDDNMENKYNPNYLKHMYEKIEKRYNQLDNLNRLLNEDLTDEDFYFLAEKAYYFTYRNQKFIKSNVLLDIKHDYLMINVRVNTNYEIDHNKAYTMEEIESLFKNESILYESHFISEDNDIEDVSNYKVCSDEEFSYYYNRFTSLNRIVSDKSIKEVRRILTKDRIKSDYEKLLEFTESELGYLSRIYGENDYFKL